MNTEDLAFYHGTGAEAARAILMAGARDTYFDEIGARTLGREIRQALLDHTGLSADEDWRLHDAFSSLGSEYSNLWVPALRQLDDPELRSLFDYGHFFATCTIANAYRYTLGNPYRSEFIRVLAESLKILSHVGHELPRTIASRFPEMDRAINCPPSPVVLELRGIARERLLTEDGDSDIDKQLQLLRAAERYPEVRAPLAFRIRNVTVGDVVAVHVLDGWDPEVVHDSSWEPSPSQVADARMMVRDFLTLL